MFRLMERKSGLSEHPGMTGTLTVKVYGPDGQLKDVRGPIRNLITNIGKDYICNQLGSGLSNSKTKRSCRWTGIGHGALAAAAAQTKLTSYRARRRNTFTHTIGRGYYSCIVTFTSFGPGGSYSGKRKATIYESGLFWLSQTQDNGMLCRQTFAAVSKLSADTLTVEWRVSIS